MSRHWTLAALAAACLALSPLAALAHEYKLGDLVIHHPWTRATPPGAPVAGGYAAIKNTGTTPDKLIGGSFEASEKFEIHEMKMDGDVMKMAELPGGLDLPPGADVKLEPGGLHLMFVGLKRPLKEGEKVKGMLVFEKAGTIAVEFAVDKMGAKGEGDHAAHSAHSSSAHSSHAEKATTAMTGNDSADIEAVMKAIFDKPENPLSVGPVSVVKDHGVAGWVQGETGGRALLRRKDGIWTIHLCSGDSLKSAEILTQTGIDAETAAKLASVVLEAEAKVDPERLSKFALFEGTVMVDAEAKHDVHGGHKHGAPAQ